MNSIDSTNGDAGARGFVEPTAAEVYERDFVPALFAVWSPIVLDAAEVAAGQRVVDVGCGTGVLARAAHERVGPEGEVVGVDPNQGMLAVARSVGSAIDWRCGRASSIPVADGWADAVVSQFALMFVDDRSAAAAEMARSLRPNGRLAVATWASIERNPGSSAMYRLLEESFGSTIANELLAPYSIGSADELASALGSAFEDVAVEEVDRPARFASIEAWVHAEIRGWTLSAAIDDEMYDAFLAEARGRWTRFVAADGSVEFSSPALVATARR